MGLRFDPVGGGQFKQAVRQIMEAESQPLKLLEAQKSKEKARLKLFEEFKGKFSGLDKSIGEISTYRQFRELKAELGDGANLCSVSLDKETADPGSYQVEIDSVARKASLITTGFEDPKARIFGTGFITMDLPDGGTSKVYVDDEHSSLDGIAKLINSKEDFPVRAAVVKDDGEDDDGKWKMIITAKDGVKNSDDDDDDDVAYPDFYLMGGDEDLEIDDTHDPENATLKVNGFEIENENNDIKDFLPGVGLHIESARPDHPFTLKITEDLPKIAGKVKAMVDQINGILAFITKQNAVNKDSDTSTTFAGDSSLQSIEYRLRNLMQEGFPVTEPGSDDVKMHFLNEIGIEFEKNGQLSFKEDKFNKIMEKDFGRMSEVFTGPNGFAFQMRTLLSGYTRLGDGLLGMREQGMRSRIKDIDDQIDSKNRALERRQRSLTEQYSRLEASLADMQKQQQYLSATLPSGGNGNLVSQLLGG